MRLFRLHFYYLLLIKIIWLIKQKNKKLEQGKKGINTEWNKDSLTMKLVWIWEIDQIRKYVVRDKSYKYGKENGCELTMFVLFKIEVFQWTHG